MAKVKFACKKCNQVITAKSNTTEGICPYCGRVYYADDIEDGMSKAAQLEEKKRIAYNEKKASLTRGEAEKDIQINRESSENLPRKRVVNSLPDAELRTLGKDGKPQKGINNIMAEKWSVCTAIAAILISVLLVCTGIRSSNDTNANANTTDYSTDLSTQNMQDIINELQVTSVVESDELPKIHVTDSMMKSTLKLMFDKEYAQITLDDLASILYFGVYYEEGADGMRTYHMEYSTEDYKEYENISDFNYTVNTIDFEESSYIFDASSISCLPNLNRLAVYGEIEFNADDFPNLTSITVDSMDLTELCYSCDTTRIEEIFIYTNIDSLYGITNFENLKSLSFNAYMVEDLSPLEKMTTLEKLKIYYATIADDFSAIKNLTNLKVLQLEAPLLKDVSFLSYLTNLQSLSLTGTQVTDYEPLEALSELQYLDVSQNTSVNDISPIGTLTNLRELGIYADHVKGLESLENLKNLTGLYILGNENIEELQFIRSLNKLEYLELDSCSNITELDFIKGLPALQELYLIATPVSSLDAIAEAPLLSYLYIDGEGVTVGTENLFDYIQLQYVRLMNMDVRADFTKIKQMQNLTQLYLSQVDIYQKEEESENYKQITMDEALQNLVGLEGLEYLQLPSNGITDISFVKDLPALKALDVHDNSINDFSALDECEQLVWSDTRGNPGE